MIRVISSPSSSTMGLATLILLILRFPLDWFSCAAPRCACVCGFGRRSGPYHRGSSVQAARVVAVEGLVGRSADPIGEAFRRDPYRGACWTAARPRGPGKRRRSFRRRSRAEALSGRGEAVPDRVVEQGPQRGPIAVDIGDHDGPVVQSELLPGHDLEGLVEGPQAARQETRSHRPTPTCATLRSCMFSTMICSVRFLWPRSTSEQMPGDDPHDLAAGRHHGFRDDAHQTDVAAAVNQAYAAGGNLAPELGRSLGIGRRSPVAGAAINTQGGNSGHNRLITPISHKRE